MANQDLPLVFACSGCSIAGATVDRVARELDRRGMAEMSCLAGIAAGRKPFFKKLRNRQAWVMDGCPIHCAMGVFERAAIDSSTQVSHVRLHEAGLRKHAPPPTDEAVEQLIQSAVESATPRSAQQPMGVQP